MKRALGRRSLQIPHQGPALVSYRRHSSAITRKGESVNEFVEIGFVVGKLVSLLARGHIKNTKMGPTTESQPFAIQGKSDSPNMADLKPSPESRPACAHIPN